MRRAFRSRASCRAVSSRSVILPRRSAISATLSSAAAPDWSVSAPAQRVGVEVLREPARERFCSDTLRLIAAERPKLARALRSLGLSVWDASANYLLARLPETTAEAPQLAERLLLGHGIAVRPCGDYSGLDARYFRVAVRVGSENARLVQALEAALAG
jgi:histidinol-phosphate/aromatic aminotransferase/cobyric acid decarboxylase-like protein